MFDIIRVGIPLRTCDITTAFVDAVNEVKSSTDCIAFCTVDYNESPTTNNDYTSAPAGHKYLFENLPVRRLDTELHYNAINTIGYIWSLKTPNGMNRDADFLSLHILDLLSKLQKSNNFTKVYMFTPGSPHIMDAFTNSMPKFHPVSVIDTYSSITIVGNAMKDHIGNGIQYKLRHYNMDFIQGPLNKVIFPGVINLFGGIAKGYNHNQGIPMVLHFFQELRKILADDDVFMYATIANDQTQLTAMTFKEAFEQQDWFLNSNDHITYGVKLNGN